MTIPESAINPLATPYAEVEITHMCGGKRPHEFDPLLAIALETAETDAVFAAAEDDEEAGNGRPDGSERAG